MIPEKTAQVAGELGVANANRDGSGTLVEVVTGGVYGTQVNSISFIAVGTTTAGMLRVFLDKGTAGTFLFAEVPVEAVIPSASAEVWSTIWVPGSSQVFGSQTGMTVEPGDILKLSTHNAEGFNFFTVATDL